MSKFKLPNLGENIESGDCVQILVKKGDQVKKDQSLLEVETDKAVIEIPSDFSGQIEDIHIQSGDRVSEGQLIFSYQSSSAESHDTEDNKKSSEANQSELDKEDQIKDDESQEEDDESQEENLSKTSDSDKEKSKKQDTSFKSSASPSVRRLARELNLNLDDLKGTGPGGRILAEDLRKAVSKKGSDGQSGFQKVVLPDFTKWGSVKREKMSSTRRSTAKNVGLAWSTIPMVTQNDYLDITKLLIKKKDFEKNNKKLTLTVILMKALSLSLKKFPQLNASLDLASEEIIFKNYYHIGLAVDSERGLVVPVIRDVDRKSLSDLSQEIQEKSQAVRDKKIKLDDLQGGTFTISNLGGIGGSFFTPIVRHPEVAILGCARSEERLLQINNEITTRTYMPLSLTYDHRLIDGADAVRFLNHFKEQFDEDDFFKS